MIRGVQPVVKRTERVEWTGCVVGDGGSCVDDGGMVITPGSAVYTEGKVEGSAIHRFLYRHLWRNIARGTKVWARVGRR